MSRLTAACAVVLLIGASLLAAGAAAPAAPDTMPPAKVAPAKTVPAATVTAAPAVAATATTAAPAPPAKPSQYIDGVYGFSIQPPAFPVAEQGNAVPVMLLGPSVNGMASNVNVMIQNVVTTRDAYRKLSLAQMKPLGMKMLSDKDVTAAGRDAILMSYEGQAQGRTMQFLSLSVIDATRVYVITCTASQDSYAAMEKEFQACLNSFSLAK
jgi:hypothetical protein